MPDISAPNLQPTIETVFDELRKRSDRTIIRQVWDAQLNYGWPNEVAYGVMARHLSDALEATIERLSDALAKAQIDPFITVAADGTETRHVYLGNAAREMYDALKAIVPAYDDARAAQHGHEILAQARAAIAKAEGR